MRRLTAGQLALEHVLPPGSWQPGTVLDKSGMDTLLTQLATEHPDKYREALHGLMQLGRENAYLTGGTSFGLRHLSPASATLAARDRIQRQFAAIRQQRLPPAQKQAAIEAVMDSEGNKLTKAIYAESRQEQNPLALQVLSGSRGNESSLRSLRGFDVAYQDDQDRRLPIPILHSYSEGLTPAEYYAGAYGARHGVVSTKVATAKGGYLLKQFTQAAHRLAATDLDSPTPNEYRRGLPVETTDSDNSGALLAMAHGSHPVNTVLTPRVLSDLKQQGFDKLLVRSPTVGGPSDGGLYARDIGIRERGRLPLRGETSGIPAAQALGERLTQGALGAKHGGGVVGAGPSGLDLVNALIQAPEIFPGGATHAETDGAVGDPQPAPQGGHYVHISGQQHYIDPDQKLLVTPGQTVEAGDVLTTGIPQPEAIVKHKGIGEGRRYLTQALRRAFRDSGLTANRRNVELVSRGLLDHVRFTDLWQDYIPDDVVPYHVIEGNWTPRPGTELKSPKASLGRYLEQPVLHHTVGTQIKPSMLADFAHFGVHSIPTHREPPPFEPEMVRAAASISTDPDWQARLLGSGQKASLLEGTHRGAVSDEHGTSYVPALISGKFWHTKV